MIKLIIKEIKEIIKKLLFRYTKIGAPTYAYNLEPSQLAEIVDSLNKVKNIEGCICEIGVARGLTTMFICEHIKDFKNIPRFYCIDTYSSFVKEDMDFEVERRNKKKSELSGFSYNNFEIWKKNFKKFNFVKAIQTDVKKFDFSKIKPIKFALLDVDLYLPTLAALRELKENMCKGGIVVVDDVNDNNSWDGANQAFFEFIKENSLNFKLIGKKCGVIEFN